MTPRPTAPADNAQLIEHCIHLGARLAATVRDGTRADVQALLAELPGPPLSREGAALVVALAAMVDPDTSPAQALEWSFRPPAERLAAQAKAERAARGPLLGGRPRLPREHGTDRGYGQHRYNGDEACAECTAAHAVAQRPKVCQQEYARLRAQGVPVLEAAEASKLRNLLAARARTA